jgi:hypothetical protein
MQLYTIRFTTQTLVRKYDEKGKNIISTTQLDSPITMTALPFAAAQSYAGCDNFVMERYEADSPRYVSKGPGRDQSVGIATRKFSRKAQDDAVAISRAPVSHRDTVAEAARTGNMAGALNE